MVDRLVMETEKRNGPKRIMIFMPPRHGKSEFISKYYPAWYLGVHPDRRIILASHTARLAQRFGGAARNLVTEYGKDDFGIEVDTGSSAKGDWSLKPPFTGGMLTAGVGGDITGRGADLFIIDDAFKNAEQAISPVYRDNVWEWWQSTASTRLEPNATVIIMFTRWHEDDLAGRLLHAAEIGEGEPWTVISLAAIAEDDDLMGRQPGEALWPERFDTDSLENIRLNKTSYWWSSMYQQRPGRYGNPAWPESYFNDIYAEEEEWPSEFQASVIAIDPSKGKDQKKSDFCAMVFLGIAKGKLWVEARMKRIATPQIVKEGTEWYIEKNPSMFGIEADQFQELFIGEFEQEAAKRAVVMNVTPVVTGGINKEIRIERLTKWLSRNLIKVRPTGGGRELVRELREFPQCNHDDGPDALEMAFRILGNSVEADNEVIGQITGV